MMIKVSINTGSFSNCTMFAEVPKTERCGTDAALFHEVCGFAQKFRAECMITGKSMAVPHFINWMNKYTSIKCSGEVPTIGTLYL
jgi:hypothetical protein